MLTARFLAVVALGAAFLTAPLRVAATTFDFDPSAMISLATPSTPELTFSLVSVFFLRTPTGSGDHGVARIDFSIQYDTAPTGPLLPTPVGPSVNVTRSSFAGLLGLRRLD